MKNLTQLPWSGKGSKAKNDNTLGRIHLWSGRDVGNVENTKNETR